MSYDQGGNWSPGLSYDQGGNPYVAQPPEPRHEETRALRIFLVTKPDGQQVLAGTYEESDHELRVRFGPNAVLEDVSARMNDLVRTYARCRVKGNGLNA